MAVQSSTRKWVFIGGGVIAAVALVVLFQNYPPQSKDAAGTIGAAQRYHEPQITGADVAVSQDALTTWIQSDTFDRIVKDPQARRLFADAAVTALFNDAALKMKLQDAGAQSADADAVRLKHLVGLDDARGKMVEVTLDTDAARKLSEVLGKDSARALKAAIEGGDGVTAKKLHLVVSPDLAVKLHLVAGDGVKWNPAEFKDATDAAKWTPAEFKDRTDAARTGLAFTTDEARRLTFAVNQDFARMQNLDRAGSDQMTKKFHLSIAPDEARKLTEIVGPDAARKLGLNEAKDSARRISLDLDGDSLRALKVALGGDGMRRMEVVLGPDAMRKLTFAIDMDAARNQNIKINGDAVRVMTAAMDNAAISAALNNADFVRAISANASLLDGLVVKTRSEMADNMSN